MGRAGLKEDPAPEVTRAERTNNDEEHSNKHLLHGGFSGYLLAVRLEDKGYCMDAYILGCCRCWRGRCNTQRTNKSKEKQWEVKQKMNVFDMTKEDFDKVPKRGGFSKDIGKFDALVIIPQDYAHCFVMLTQE